MGILYDSEKIKTALRDFYNATGVNICLIKEGFSEVTGISSIVSLPSGTATGYCEKVKENEKTRRGCVASDCNILKKCKQSKKMEMHICHAGLVDIAIPVMYGTKVLCYIIMGQMKKEADFETVKKNLRGVKNIDELRRFYDELPLYDEEKIESIANLAVMLAKHLLYENMLKLGYNKNVENAIDYIDENLTSAITIDSLSKKTGVSKNVLYENFRSIFNCTINEYINDKRIEKSIHYLANSDMSMDEIAQKVGFNSAAYYSHVFKKKKGCSPIQFKKKSRR